MTKKIVHELHLESGTVIMDDGWFEPSPCINKEKCGNDIDAESGIHQFCRSCYQSWASAWFKSAKTGGEEE